MTGNAHKKELKTSLGLCPDMSLLYFHVQVLSRNGGHEIWGKEFLLARKGQMEPDGLLQLGLLWAQMDSSRMAVASAVVSHILSENVAAIRIQDSGVMV